MNLRTPVHTAAASLAVLVALGLSACGSDDEPKDEPTASAQADDDDKASDDADAVLEDVRAALADEDAVTLSGAGEDDGTTIELDLSYVGDEVTGSIGLDGAGFELLSTGGEAFLLLDDAFWTEQAGIPAEALPTVSGKWIAIDPSDPNFGDFASFADREEFLDELLSPEGDVTVGDSEEIDGVEYVVLVSTDDNGDESKLYIDPETDLPLKLASDGDLNFAYETVEIPAAPSVDQQIDPAALG